MSDETYEEQIHELRVKQKTLFDELTKTRQALKMAWTIMSDPQRAQLKLLVDSKILGEVE